MMEEDKHLDELFRSKLEKFEQKPPAYVWDGIVEAQAQSRRRKVVFWWKLGGVAAAVVLAFVLGIVWQNEKPGVRVQPGTVASIMESGKTTGLPSASLEEEKSVASSHEKSPGQSAVSVDQSGANGPIISVSKESVATEPEASSFEQSSEVLFGTNDLQETAPRMSLLGKLAARLQHENRQANRLIGLSSASSRNGLSEQDLRIIDQNRKALPEKERRLKLLDWSIGARVNPALAVNDTKYGQQYAQTMNSASSNSQMNLGAGLTVAVETQSRWSFQSGIMYNSLGQSSSNSSSREGVSNSEMASDQSYFQSGLVNGASVVVNGPAGTIVLDGVPQNALIAADFESAASASSNSVLLTNAEFEQLFNYLEIPLLVRYQLIDRTVGLQLMGGFNTGFLVGNSAYMTNESQRVNIGETANMSSVTYSTNLGLGFGYQLTPGLQLRFEPQMRYFIESLSRNPNVTYKPYTFEFYTGISYSF
ncbi:outer membrane beta-barrel protein [Mangrovibacterium sp.]|uniref:outer membrane beta-barrel protein n=1 Tax=Mangrovibacterium sp. TaxID=1961364 RepID=UPI0035662FAE